MPAADKHAAHTAVWPIFTGAHTPLFPFLPGSEGRNVGEGDDLNPQTRRTPIQSNRTQYTGKTKILSGTIFIPLDPGLCDSFWDPNILSSTHPSFHPPVNKDPSMMHWNVSKLVFR